MSSDQLLIKKIRHDDVVAFETLFRKYYTALQRFIWGYVNSEAVAEELVQELFTRIWENRADLSISGSFKSYLFRAARNLSIDHLRHQQVKQNWNKEQKAIHKYSDYPKSLDERLHDKLVLEEVKQFIQELPKRRREIFMLSRYENMKYREIADLLDISMSTVETQISRALKMLRSKFSHLLMVILMIVMMKG